jgi:hypothetical protein
MQSNGALYVETMAMTQDKTGSRLFQLKLAGAEVRVSWKYNQAILALCRMITNEHAYPNAR